MAVAPAEFARQAVMARLSADFAAVNAAVASARGVPPLEIDFAYPSRNFVNAYIDPATFDASTAAIDLPGMCWYVTECADEFAAKGMRFSGSVIAHLDTYLVYRALRDEPTAANTITERLATFDPELLVNAVEESLADTLRSEASMVGLSTAGVSLYGWRTERDPLDLVGDGVAQRLALTMGFKVHIR